MVVDQSGQSFTESSEKNENNLGLCVPDNKIYKTDYL